MAINKQDEALVLKMTNYRESDGMATLLLKQGGLRRFVYRSYYKPNSKTLARGIPLTKLLIQYQSKEEGLLRASQMEVIENYNFIKSDVKRNLYGNIYCEMMLSSIIDEFAYSKYFAMGETYLSRLNTKANPDYLLAILVSSFLQAQGLQPQVDYDVITHETKVNHFSIPEGGFRKVNKSLFTNTQLKQLRLLFKMNFSHIDSIEQQPVDGLVLSTMVEYFTYHSGINLKSWEIACQI